MVLIRVIEFHLSVSRLSVRREEREREKTRARAREREIGERKKEREGEGEEGKMKRGMNRNGRKKEARAIFLIMKTLLCVSFCFVVRGRYSNRALSYPPPLPRFPLRPAHPPSLATTTAAAAVAAAHLLFLYYNVRALSGGSDGSGAEAGLPAGCRLERVPGWDCFSNELHSSGLCVSVWGTPTFALSASLPPRVCAQFFYFFLSLSLALFLHFSPVFLIFASSCSFSMENYSCQWSPRMLGREHCSTSRSLRQVIICHDYFIRLFLLAIFSYLSCLLATR